MASALPSNMTYERDRLVTSGHRSSMVGLDEAHIWIDVVYRSLVYEYLWDGMGEIAWE